MITKYIKRVAKPITLDGGIIKEDIFMETHVYLFGFIRLYKVIFTNKIDCKILDEDTTKRIKGFLNHDKIK